MPERTEFLPTMGVSAIVFKRAGEAQITGAGGIKSAADDGSTVSCDRGQLTVP